MRKLQKLKINHLCDRVFSFPILVDDKTGKTIRDQARLDEIILRCDTQPDLLAACKESGKLLSDVIFPMGAKKQGTPIYNTIKQLEAAIKKAQAHQ